MKETLILKPDEAGKLLGLGRDLTYELVRTGVLPTIRLGKRRYILRRALNELFAQTGSNEKEE
ncbi:MAG: helix-turn-helix domain-containing protein [Armatimonadota bacterium]